MLGQDDWDETDWSEDEEDPMEADCAYGFEFCDDPLTRDMNLCTTECRTYFDSVKEDAKEQKKRLTPEEIDEYNRANVLKELAENPEETGCVVGSLFNSYFPDNQVTACSKCGVPLFVRPWLLKVAQEHNLSVVCPVCVDPKRLKGKIVQDLLKIEKAKVELKE